MLTITYVDFDDAGFTVVDDDIFEVDLEGWMQTIEAGSGMSFFRSTVKSRTGVASAQHGQGLASLESGDVVYTKKSFTIGAITRAFFRVWMLIEADSTTEVIVEVITDAGEVSQKMTLAIPFDWNPKGGTKVCDQWVVAVLKVPVNGTFEVRLRLEVESMNLNQAVNWDDIRVVQS